MPKKNSNKKIDNKDINNNINQEAVNSTHVAAAEPGQITETPKRPDIQEILAKYRAEVDIYHQRYLDSLPDKVRLPESEIMHEIRKQNSGLFKGLLKYIYTYVFKPDINAKVYISTKINCFDVRELGAAWELYTEFCYAYNQSPLIMQFQLLSGITQEMIKSWIKDAQDIQTETMYNSVLNNIDSDNIETIDNIDNNNLYINSDIENSEEEELYYIDDYYYPGVNQAKDERNRFGGLSERIQAVKKNRGIFAKKIMQECEGGLQSGALTGNPGYMFMLKAKYGYSDQPQQIVVPVSLVPKQAASEIAAKHHSAIEMNASEPEI